MKQLKKVSLYIICGAMSVSILLSCAAKPEEKKADATAAKKEPVSLETATVQFINPTYTISVPGELEPFDEVQVYAKVQGFVQKMYVDRGTYVRKNQLLAVLEAPEMDQQYLSDKSKQEKMHSDYIFSQQSYERLLAASATDGAVATIELDRAKSMMLGAKSAYESSKAGTAHASQLKDYLRIVAPFDGVITQRNLSAGALVGPGSNQPLFTIAQGNKLRLTLSIPEKHTASIQDGMKVKFTVSSHPGEVFEAKLSRTSGLLNAQNRSLILEFDVNNGDKKLQGGEYAQVKLGLQRKSPSYWVAPKSIVNAQSGTFIMTLSNKQIKRVLVKEGVRLDSLVEVFGDINEQSQVLKKPSEELKEGKVN
jgi:membrane fusion protein (multidrug efflux system)